MSTGPVSNHSHYLNFGFLSNAKTVQTAAKIVAAILVGLLGAAALRYVFRSLVGRCSSEEIAPYSKEGDAAIALARGKLQKHGSNTMPPDGKLSAIDEIALLKQLYQGAFTELENAYRTAVESNGRDIWFGQRVSARAKVCTQIAFVLSALTLDNLDLAQENSLNNPDLRMVLEIYKSARFQQDLGTCKGEKTSGICKDDDFYTDGTFHNHWRKLYNEYCRRVHLKVGKVETEEAGLLLKEAKEDLDADRLVQNS